MTDESRWGNMKTLRAQVLQDFLLLLLATGLAGCNSVIPQIMTPVATANTIEPAIPSEATPGVNGVVLPSNQELEVISSANSSRLGLLAQFSEGDFTGGMVLSPDGTLMAVAAAGGVILYDAVSGKKVDFYATANGVDSLVFSPNGQKIAYIRRVPSGDVYPETDVAGDEIFKPELTLLDLQTKTILYSTPLFGKGCGEYAVQDISFTPDGKQIVFRDTFSYLGLPDNDDICVLNAGDGSLTRSYKPEDSFSLLALSSPALQDSSVWMGVVDPNTQYNEIPIAYIQRYNPVNGTSETRIQIQNAGGIDRIIVSQTGQWLAVSSRQQAQILSTNGSVIAAIPTGQSEITTMSLSADEKSLALGYQDGSSRLYRVSDGQLISEIEPLQNQSVNVVYDPLAVGALRFSSDNKRLYRLLHNSGSYGSTIIQVISLEDNRQLFSISGRNPFSLPALSVDNSSLAWGGYEDGHVELWSTKDQKQMAALIGHTAMVMQTQFSPDGSQIATASNDGTVRLWNVADGTAQAVLGNHPGGVWAVAYSLDGKQLASVSRDGKLELWDTSTHNLIKSLDSGTAGWQVNSLIFEQEDNAILIVSGCLALEMCSAHGAGDLRRMDLSTGEITTLLPFGIEDLAFSQDRSLFSADGLQGHLVGRVSSGQYEIVKTFTSPYGNGDLRGAAISPDGSLFLSGNGAGVHAWDVASGQMIGLFRNQNQFGCYGKMYFSTDGRLFLVANVVGVINLWGMRSQ